MQIRISVSTGADPPVPAGKNKLAVVTYGNQPVPGAFNVFASGFLTETGIRNVEPALLKYGEQVMLFPAPEGFDLPFDVFSAIFWMLSRYEEYLPYVPDRHGRFEAGQSFAFRHNFLNEPVVDQWVALFRSALLNRFHGLYLPLPQFSFESTMDIDNPWAYLHKGWGRQAAGLFKQAIRLNMDELLLRCRVLAGRCRDPFDTYDGILEMEERYGFRSHIFFLLANYGQYDTNYSLRTSAFESLIRRLQSGRMLGIHPSCRSNDSRQLLRLEMQHFARLLGMKPEASRQHFLVLKLPETYRELITLDIRADYSMGFASCTGFRAGTSRPFRFYDLEKETETSLVLHPFTVMDVTLQQYLSLTPGEAIDRIDMLIGKVKSVNGVFTSLWHNESLSEQGVWKGWRGVFEEMVKMGIE
jgi:hypothetical protein